MAVSVLAACGSGSHSAAPIPASAGAPVSSGPDLSAAAPHNAAPAAGAVPTTVSINIPLPIQPSSSKRAPRYLTSYTKSLDLQSYQNGTYSGYVFYQLNALQSSCTVAGSSYSCNLTIQAPLGSGQIIAHTYDNTTVATSNMLSVATQTVTIAQNQANTITIATLPIAAKLVPGSALPQCPVYGSPATTSVSYTAYDADGGALTGLTLANTLAFVNVNPADSPSGHSWSPAAVSSGSGAAVYSYSGSDANVGAFNLTSSLSPSGVTNAVLSTFAIYPVGSAGPHMVYVSDAANTRSSGSTCAPAT